MQEDIVKLQVLNLSVKLYLTNREQTDLLCQYIFNLARYDQNYDIRDRARFLKQLISPANGKETILSKNARNIFLASKPAPLLESKYQGREQYQLGSLSHYLNIRASGYHDLPTFPKIAPDSSVRNVEIIPPSRSNSDPLEHTGIEELNNVKTKSSSKSNKKQKSFYTDSEKSSTEYSSDDGSTSDDEAEDDEEEEEEDDNNEEEDETTDDSSESSSESGEESDDETSTSDNEGNTSKSSNGANHDRKAAAKSNKQNSTATVKKPEKSNLDLLLDLSDIAPTGPIMTPSMGGFLTPTQSATNLLTSNTSRFELVGPSYIPTAKHELLNKMTGRGLQILYRFIRSPHLYSAKMISIELTFKNDAHEDLTNIHISNKTLTNGMEINEFAAIPKLGVGQAVQNILGIDFNDSTQAINFEITSSAGPAKVSLKSAVGELIRSVLISEIVFKEEQSQLRGMNEHSANIPTEFNTPAAIRAKIFELANVASVAKTTTGEASDLVLYFAGQTMSSKSLVLITVQKQDQQNKVSVTVNCEKMVVGSMLLNEIKVAFKN